MKDIKDKFENAKDKIAGEVKEAVGEMTGNEQLELKGKLQSSQADLRKKMDINTKAEEIKENIAEKINDAIDKNKKK
ncbi:MAG: CsbD family protein [Mobilitalea sp.]